MHFLQGLDYWWVETARIKTQCKVTTLAWNHDATRFLTAGEYLQLWQHEVIDEKVTFDIGQDDAKKSSQTSWSCLWKTRPANPIEFLAYRSSLPLMLMVHKLVARWPHRIRVLIFLSNKY